MSALRDEIRAILREEIAALRSEAASPPPAVETVRITSGADLTRFARDIAARAADPGVANRIASGALRFELSGGAAYAPTTAASHAAPARSAAAPIDKPLITERDIAALGRETRALQLGKLTRLTPLARDEARRRGIRIERTER
ncbi:hypothetical protein G5B38_12660 [Pseudohalocynthiibacter aestuariivivens]|nr:hypothetical protein [Pseudohalocynthiibacter aestuariivivens]QIE46306.1 hypothetical protein G5B38_12660 [Pseudohalocynthiibacter aestuariivivens]